MKRAHCFPRRCSHTTRNRDESPDKQITTSDTQQTKHNTQLTTALSLDVRTRLLSPRSSLASLSAVVILRVAIMRALLLSLSLAALCLIAPASAQLQWGPVGHWATAAVAGELLTPSAANGARNLLPNVDGDISAIASWADSYARDKYPWSAQLHFADTPDWVCNYNMARDCHGSKGEPMAVSRCDTHTPHGRLSLR